MSKDKKPRRIIITLGQCLKMVESMNEHEAQYFIFYEDTLEKDLDTISPYSMIDPDFYRNDLN